MDNFLAHSVSNMSAALCSGFVNTTTYSNGQRYKSASKLPTQPFPVPCNNCFTGVLTYRRRYRRRHDEWPSMGLLMTRPSNPKNQVWEVFCPSGKEHCILERAHHLVDALLFDGRDIIGHAVHSLNIPECASRLESWG